MQEKSNQHKVSSTQLSAETRNFFVADDVGYMTSWHDGAASQLYIEISSSTKVLDTYIVLPCRTTNSSTDWAISGVCPLSWSSSFSDVPGIM